MTMTIQIEGDARYAAREWISQGALELRDGETPAELLARLMVAEPYQGDLSGLVAYEDEEAYETFLNAFRCALLAAWEERYDAEEEDPEALDPIDDDGENDLDRWVP